jgi:hypothetical protein
MLVLISICVLVLAVILLYLSQKSGLDTLAPCPDGKLERVSLPLNFDSRIGVYRSKIRLGNRDRQIEFSVVPDTGSSHLLVSGDQCSNCPLTDGVWDRSLGQDVSQGKKGLVTYGGGQRIIYIPWQAHFMNYNHSNGKEVNFGVVVNSYSPDGIPVNILGLQEKPNSFLDGLCGEKTVVFDFPHNRLYLGKSDDILFPNNGNVTTFHLDNPTNGAFYPIGKIKEIRINGQKIPLGIQPKFAIIDTGTTDTFVLPDFYSYIRSLGAINLTVEIIFEKANIDSYGSSLVFNIPTQTITTQRINHKDSMLIGNSWLRQYVTGFRFDQDQFVFVRPYHV